MEALSTSESLLTSVALLSRRPLFARAHITRPFKSRRTFDSFWHLIVRDSPGRHLRHSGHRLTLTWQHEQSTPHPLPRPAHLSETVKFCQNRVHSTPHPAQAYSPTQLTPCDSTGLFSPAYLTRPVQKTDQPISTHPPNTAKPERSGATRTSSYGTCNSPPFTHRAGLSTCTSYRDGAAPLTGLLLPRRRTT